MSASSRIREFRHLFAGNRRIVATIRVDLDRIRCSNALPCFCCVWDGSKERQPSAELYPECRQWVDSAVSDVVEQTGTPLLHAFELPGDTRTVEVWFYDPGEKPRLAKTLPNPFHKPLSEMLAGMPPENWEDES